jgi:hypothetical protein
LIHKVDQITAAGGTPLGAYMKVAADLLLQERKKQYGYGSYRLLILTDGEANDPKLVELYTPMIISRGIVTDVIGVDMASDHTLATKVQSYRRANDPASLKKALQDVFAEIDKGQVDSSGLDAFAELKDFPSALALTILDTLRSSGDEPLGSKISRQPIAPVATGSSVKPTNAPLHVQTTSSTPLQQTTPVNMPTKGSNKIWIFIAVFIGFILYKSSRK